MGIKTVPRKGIKEYPTPKGFKHENDLTKEATPYVEVQEQGIETSLIKKTTSEKEDGVPLVEPEETEIEVLTSREYDIEKNRKPEEYYDIDLEKEREEIDKAGLGPALHPSLRAAAQGTGTYVGIRIEGPYLTGNRGMRYTVKFWSRNAYNWDGNWIQIWKAWEGKPGFATRLNNKLTYDRTTYTESKPYAINHDWSLGTSNSWAQCEADTHDIYSYGGFYAKSGVITMYQGTFSAAIQAVSQTGTTLRMTYRSVQGEDFALGWSGNWWVVRPNSTGSGGSTFDTTVSLGNNTARDVSYGQIRDGGSTSDPWVWGSKTIRCATNFTSMSMPTVSAKRDPSNPANVIVSWTAGGTTNKPQGLASRRSVLILRQSGGANVQVKYDINLEAAGSYTFTGCPMDIGFNAFAEYSISGLNGGTKYQGSNYVWIDTAFSTKVKVGGTYRNSTEGWVKVGGTYRKIVEGWVKVGGSYRRIT